VFRGDVDGKVPTFERIGLKGSNFFMRDRETDSHWQQLTGECFEGPLQGERLARLPFLLTTWGEWRKVHPETLALVPEPAYKANYEVMAKRNTSLPLSGQSPGRGAIHEDSRLPPHEQVMGIEAGGAHKAYPLASLQKRPVLNDQVGTTPVLVVHNAAGETTTVFSRALQGRTLTFQAAKQETVDAVIDNETRSKWTAYGECTAGKLKGQKLDTIVPLPSFWFAWAEFYPDTQIYSGAEQ
jgi:hypothetical protein